MDILLRSFALARAHEPAKLGVVRDVSHTRFPSKVLRGQVWLFERGLDLIEADSAGSRRVTSTVSRRLLLRGLRTVTVRRLIAERRGWIRRSGLRGSLPR